MYNLQITMAAQSELPIPVFSVPKNVQPVPQIKIPLYWHSAEGINWSKLGEMCTLGQIEEAIFQSANQRLPNGLLPALDPGDVVILFEGEFWINREWQLNPYCAR